MPDNNFFQEATFGQDMPLFVVEEVESHPNEEQVEISIPAEDVIFVVDKIPGAPEAEEIEEEEADEEVIIDEEASNEWKWSHCEFIDWLKKMIEGVPKHSGYDSTGLEKAISYFEALNKEISRAMRTDFKNEIDSAKAEKAREQIEEGINRLLERLERVTAQKYKRKKKGWAEELGFVKEAQKHTKINGITITVPLLISTIARICINGTVSAGHDIEDMFEKLCKEYSLDKREKLELNQLLRDMGYPIRGDRGIPVGEEIDQTRSDNFDWAANYTA